MKKSGWLVALGCAFALAGCTYTIRYKPVPPQEDQPVHALRVGVAILNDRTDGDHWSGGMRVSTPAASLSQCIAQGLRDANLFREVRFLPDAGGGDMILARDLGQRYGVDALLMGELIHFYGSSGPRWWGTASPLAPFTWGPSLFGLPTVPGFCDIEIRCSLRLLDLNSGHVLWHEGLLNLRTEDATWGCPYGIKRTDESLLAIAAAKLVEQIIVSLQQWCIRSTPSQIPRQLATSAPDSPSLPLGKRWALVVGISEYKNAGQGGLTRLQSARVGTGRLVFTASRAGETSRESADWGGGHGVFTHFLLLGLRGEAGLNRNGTVTVGELTDYVDEQVRRATRSAQNPAKSGNLDRELPLSARPSRNP